MTPETWEELTRAFTEAIALDPAAREQFVADVSAANPALGEALTRMLAVDSADDGVLHEPIAAGARRLAESGPDPWIDRQLGAYTVVRRIAAGGMGAVFLAERSDRQFKQRVAIKVMGAQLLSPESVTRFKAERQILATLDHPYIARLIDGGTTETGLPYLVMEYVVGVPIDRYCDDHRLEIPERLRLFQKVCEAVDYAHRNLIVHRDLKPNNILVDTAGNPKLLDFGIAKLLDAQERDLTMAATREGFRVMTPEYASPEQVRGEPVSVASDVHALGTLLYKLLCGRLPFHAADQVPGSLARAILETEPSRPSDAIALPTGWTEKSSTAAEIGAQRRTSAPKLRSLLSGDLDNIVLAALRKEPERRYPSAVALSRDIDNYLGFRPVEARPVSLGYRAAKFARRNLAGIGTTTGVIVLTLVGVLQILAERDRAEVAAEQAQQVSAFLTKLFQNASPFVSQGRDVTAVQLLEEGTREIDALQDQPALQAELYRAMGESYSMLGDFDLAIATLQRSKGLLESLGDAETLAYADTLQKLGEAQRQNRDLSTAETNTRRSLALRQRLLGSPDPLVAFTIGRLGNIQYQKRERELALATLERAVAMKRSLGEEDDAEFADIIGNLGITLDSLGRYDEAEVAIEEAVALSLRHDGELHPNTIVRQSNLGLIYVRQGRYVEAARQFDQCLAASRRVWPENHPSVTRNMRNLAAARKRLGEFPEAVALYREAVAAARAHSGERSVVYVRSLRGLGSVLRDMARYEEADAAFEEALAISIDLRGEDSYDSALLRLMLGQSQLDRGHYAAAEPLLRFALAHQDKLGRSSTLAARRELAASLSGQGRVAEAGAMFDTVLAEKEQAVGPDSASLVRDLSAAAGNDRRRGDIDRALGRSRRALDIASERMPPGNWLAALAVEEYGRCLRAAGRDQEAMSYLTRAHEDLRATFGTADPRVKALAELVTP